MDGLSVGRRGHGHPLTSCTAAFVHVPGAVHLCTAIQQHPQEPRYESIPGHSLGIESSRAPLHTFLCVLL